MGVDVDFERIVVDLKGFWKLLDSSCKELVERHVRLHLKYNVFKRTIFEGFDGPNGNNHKKQ